MKTNKMVNRGKVKEKQTDYTEVFELVTNQSLYILQLEHENSTIKDELVDFKKRLHEVLSENQGIQDGLRAEVVNRTINIATDVIDGNTSIQSRKMFEAKVEGLETEAKITQRNLEEALRENETLKEAVKRQDALLRMPATLANKKNVPLDEINANIPIIERLTKERDELTKSIASLRASVTSGQEEEAKLRREVQKTLAALEDMQLEKGKLQIENSRLSKDLELTRGRLEKEISETHWRSSEAATNERKACKDEMEELLKKVGELTSMTGVYENQLEASGRVNAELTVQLEDSKRQLLQANKDLGRMRSEVEHEVGSALKGYKAAEDELRETKAKLEHQLLKNEQERVRLEHTTEQTHQRLSAAQDDAIKSRELSVKLTEELNNAKQELQKVILQRDMITKHSDQEIMDLRNVLEHRETKSNDRLRVMQAEYESRLTEVENISVKQASLIKRLREEGSSLQGVINDLGKKYRKRVGSLTQENDIYKERIERLSSANKEMEEQIVGHGITHRQMHERLCELHERATRTTGQAANAIEELDRIAQDRDLLDREVKFLQSQIIPDSAER